MKGLSFYYFLREKLIQNQVIGISKKGLKYTFSKWGVNGDLKYNSSGTIKSIPLELIVSSYYVFSKNIIIDNKWLEKNGKNDWCTAPVLNYLIKEFSKSKKEK
jgi:hypothetical protein